MPQGQASIFQYLNKLLRVQHDAFVNEPLPQRWVDLIAYLNEQERSNTQDSLPQTKPGNQDPPTRH
jgi:hypothetical protein